MVERHYTIREIVEHVGILETTLRAAIENRELGFVRFSPQGRYHIAESELTRWLEACRAKHGHVAPPTVERMKAPRRPASSPGSVLDLLPKGYKRQFA